MKHVLQGLISLANDLRTFAVRNRRYLGCDFVQMVHIRLPQISTKDLLPEILTSSLCLNTSFAKLSREPQREAKHPNYISVNAIDSDEDPKYITKSFVDFEGHDGSAVGSIRDEHGEQMTTKIFSSVRSTLHNIAATRLATLNTRFITTSFRRRSKSTCVDAIMVIHGFQRKELH